MTRFLRRLAIVTVAFGAFLTASCGVGEGDRIPDTGGTLEGTVTFGTSKIEFAVVTVTTTTASAQGRVDENGRYKIVSVPLGEVKIGVDTSAARGDFQTKIMQQNSAAADPNKSKRIEGPKFVDVPEKFFNPETSGLTTTIAKGPNTFDIKIPK